MGRPGTAGKQVGHWALRTRFGNPWYNWWDLSWPRWHPRQLRLTIQMFEHIVSFFCNYSFPFKIVIVLSLKYLDMVFIPRLFVCFMRIGIVMWNNLLMNQTVQKLFNSSFHSLPAYAAQGQTVLECITGCIVYGCIQDRLSVCQKGMK